MARVKTSNQTALQQRQVSYSVHICQMLM